VTARDLLHLAWVIPALPALGAVVLLLFGKRMREPIAGWVATTLMTLSFLASIVVVVALHSMSAEARADALANTTQGFTWIHVAGFDVPFRFLVDQLSSVMILFITGVGALIHLYAIGYMHGDERFSRFFAYMNLFAASMLTLVLGANFLITFLGWEGVGLCSYLLISFWFERNSAAVAGKKAFVTNRVGDFGFMLAMFLIFSKVGSLNYASIGRVHLEALHLSNTTVTAIALLLFLGAVGKSAQLPLYIWLPDAMEGPTPVSALIHAATMVTAGVFLVVRAHTFFDLSDHAGQIVAWVGAITALFAATIALMQNDIKRVLAYSTISQLGYMFLAAGVGAYSAAIFHMVMHAFFKALLFLGAGSVIHGMHGEQDMRKMGGLRKFMPYTAGTFIVGWLAIAGVIPFAGFWSKDEILARAWYSDSYALWFAALIGALLTAFYMTRQVWLVFFDGERWQSSDSMIEAAEHDAHAEPHESPWTMYVPLFALAGLTLIGGLLDLPFTNARLNLLDRWLEPLFAGVKEPAISSFWGATLLTAITLTGAVIGIIIARALYLHGLNEDGSDPAAERLGGFAGVLANGYYIDYAWSRFVSGPISAFARALSDGIDRTVIDGAVNGVGRVVREGGQGLRRVQTGLVRNYALAILAGTVVLLAYVSTRATL